MSLEMNASAAGAPNQADTRTSPIGRVELIPRGEGRCFVVGSLRVAIFRQRDDSVFALEASCPHAGGPLADGLVGGGVVICPLHAQRFRLADGAGLDSELRVTTYRVEVRAGWIFLAATENS